MGDFCREIMTLNFGYDRPVDSAETVSAVLEQLGLDAAYLLPQATTQENKEVCVCRLAMPELEASLVLQPSL